MTGLMLVGIALVWFACAYLFYGRWLAKTWGIDPKAPTPAVRKNDGQDYSPASRFTVFAHQFSSITGAGPVTGPIIAAMFGWLPAFLWILIGGAFFGAVQDFTALYASVKNEGKSMGLPIEQYVDLETKNLYAERVAAGYDPADVMASIYARSRDNARTPMQWSVEKNAGFSDVEPWMPVNPNYTVINAEAALADPDSVFYCYRKLIALRKTYPVFRDGRFTLLLPDSEQIFAYTRDTERERLLVVCNFTAEAVPFARPEAFREAKLLISNYPEPAELLRPYEAQMFYLEN